MDWRGWKGCPEARIPVWVGLAGAWGLLCDITVAGRHLPATVPAPLLIPRRIGATLGCYQRPGCFSVIQISVSVTVRKNYLGILVA